MVGEKMHTWKNSFVTWWAGDRRRAFDSTEEIKEF
jgi:hypothetical protein